MARHLLGAVAVVYFVGFAGSLEAVSAAPTAEQLIQQGLDLRRSGHDFDALAKFESAYGLTKTPRAAAQWGLCLQAVSRWAEADALLAEALAATQDAWVRKNRQILKESLEAVKAHVGRVEVIGEPVGAAVTVDGKSVGLLPLRAPIPVNEGSVEVEVSSAGYVQVSRTVIVTGSNYQRVVVRLKRTEAGFEAGLSPRATMTPPPSPSSSDPSLSITAAPPPSSVEESSLRPLRIGSFVAGGVGVAAVATGVYFGMRAKTLGEENSTAAIFDPSKDDAGKSAQTLQYVFLGAGAAVLAAGGVMLFVDGRRSDAGSSIAVAPLKMPGGAGVVAGGRF